jgi:ankyrin repeat protein
MHMTEIRVTYFDYVASRGHYLVVKMLAEHGAEIHRLSIDGSTPFGIAAAHGYLDILEYLFETSNSDAPT